MTTQLAIETWTLSWSAIRDEFCARLRGLHLAPWWEQARLLCVLKCSYGYALGVQRAYNKRRGKNLLLSPLDWLLVEMYAIYDIPLTGIIRGLDFMFDRRDRAPEIQHINSLEYCHQAICKETRLIRESSVGSHGDYRDWDPHPTAHTLLLAVPPAGRMTFAAMQSQRQVDRVIEIFDVGIVFTVYPDAWHKSEAQKRYHHGLEFLDDAPCNGHYGGTEARSVSQLQESPALDVPQPDDRGPCAPAANGETQPLSNRPLHPPIATAELHSSEVHAELAEANG